MPILLWQSIVESIQTALEAKTAIDQARRTGRGRPFAIAASGFLLCLAVGSFLHSTALMAVATVPPALVAWWGARMAWGSVDDRRPALSAGLLCIGLSGLLYTTSVVIPSSLIPQALSLKLLWFGVGSLVTGLLLALLGWFRGEWSSI